MPRLTVGDATLNVEDCGQGPVLVLVHGYPLDHQMWRHQIDEFSRDHRVIAPDLRGFGQSTATPGVVTMERHADDLVALLDGLGVAEPVTLCGLSMGGYVAFAFAVKHRSRLAKLILCDTKAAGDTTEAAKTRLESAQKVLAEGPQAIVDGMVPKLFADAVITQQTDIVKAIRKVMLDTKPEGIAAALRGMAERPNVISQLPTIDAPTLVICGEHDVISPVAEMRAIAEALPHGQFVVIAGAGHMAPLEKPAEVNTAIRAFLA